MTTLDELYELNFKSPSVQHLHRVQLNSPQIEKLLEINTNNIPPTPTKISLYADNMVNGDWLYNGDAIRVSSSGVLLDGQNRLLAAQKAKMNLTCDLIVGLDEGVFNTIDQGRTRHKGHLVARDKSLTGGDAKFLTSSITRIIKYKEKLAQTTAISKGGLPSKFTADKVIEYIERNPQILEQLEVVKKEFPKLRSNLTQSIVLYIYHLGSIHDEEYTLKYLKKLTLGVGLKEDETLYHYNRILNDIKAKKLRWTVAEKEQTLMKVWSRVATKGLNAISNKNSIKVTKDDDYVQFAKPTEQALIEMKNSI